MALPAHEDFTGAAGNIDAPPWTLQYVTCPGRDGSGHGTIPNGNGNGLWGSDAFPNDQFAEIDTLWTPSSGGVDYVILWVRGTFDFGTGDVGDGYWLATDGVSDTSIIKRIGGTDTTLGTFNSFTFSSGDRLRLEAVGTNIGLSKNGVGIFSVSDADIAGGAAGVGGFSGGAYLTDNWTGDAAAGGGPPPGTHVVTGRGSFGIASPAFLKIALDGLPGRFTTGAAEPPNYYHVGMVSWGTANGHETAHVVTREIELIPVPANMTLLAYEFASGLTATITELGAP
jgi:hypothetical protein